MSETRVGTARLCGLGAEPETVIVRPRTGAPGIDVRGGKGRNIATVTVTLALKAAGVDPEREALEAVLDSDRDTEPEHDLAIALGIAARQGRVPARPLAEMVTYGGLDHSGGVTYGRGIVPVATWAGKEGRKLAAYAGQRDEAAWGGPVDGVFAWTLRWMLQAMGSDEGVESLDRRETKERDAAEELLKAGGTVRSWERLAIAAAGHHNIRLPAGHTWRARALTTLLGPLSDEELLEIATIRSVAGLLGREPMERPLRAPHWTVREAAMSGRDGSERSRRAEPGELTLAHRGVLALALHESWEQDVIGAVVTADATRRTRSGMPATALLVGTEGHERAGNGGFPEELFALDGTPDQATDQIGTIDDARRLVGQIARAVRAQERRYGAGLRNGTAAPESLVNARARLSSRAREIRDLATEYRTAGPATSARSTGEARTVLSRIARTVADLRGNTTVTAAAMDEAVAAWAKPETEPLENR